MNPHVLDPDTDARLRALDAAPANQPVDPTRRASTLTTILTTDPGLPAEAPVALPRRRRPLRWAALTGAAAAVTAGALVLPGLFGGEAAYASWTPTPEVVAATDLAKVVDECRGQLGDLTSGPGAPPVSPGAFATRLAERRGTWVFLTMTATTATEQFSAECLAELPTGSSEGPSQVSTSMTGGGGWSPPEGSEMVEGGMSQYDPSRSGLLDRLVHPGPTEPASATNGLVGPDVVGVTIHAGDLRVQASVEDGTYAAWWPGLAFDLPDSLPPSGQWSPPSIVTYDLTLKDGTIIKDAKSTYRDPKTGEVSTPSGPITSESTTD